MRSYRFNQQLHFHVYTQLKHKESTTITINKSMN